MAAAPSQEQPTSATPRVSVEPSKAVLKSELPTGFSLLATLSHRDLVLDAEMSRDGTRVVTASADKTARIWNAKTGALVTSFQGHAATLHTAEFSPDTTRVVTSSDDATAKVWDVTTGKIVWNLKGHAARLQAARFSRDAQSVLTVSDDDSAKLWDARTGKLLFSLAGHPPGSMMSLNAENNFAVEITKFDVTQKYDDKNMSIKTASARDAPVVATSWVDGALVDDTTMVNDSSPREMHRPHRSVRPAGLTRRARSMRRRHESHPLSGREHDDDDGRCRSGVD